MRILLFLGFLALTVLVPVGLAQAQAPQQIPAKAWAGQFEASER